MCRLTAGRSARRFALALLLFVSPAILSGAVTMGQEPETVTLTMEQWARLKANSEKQNEIIRKQAALWNLLSASQKQQAETLNQQREEIENSQKEMAETRQSLERANSLLKKANESLENQKKSYQKLTEETESVLQRKNHEIVIAKRQRDTWAIGAGLIGVLGIFLAVSD